MKCYGTCQMLRGLIKDITGLSSGIHMRTDANNLVTTASTTHVPEQQETIHMIQMLRKEACSGSIADLSHIRTQWCLADCLTKKSANPQNLTDAVRSGTLKEVDSHPPCRSLLGHKAYFRSWLPTVCNHVDFGHDVFLLGDSLRISCFLNLCLRLKSKGPETRSVSSQCLALIGGAEIQSRRRNHPMIHQIEIKNIKPIKVRIVSTMSHREDILLVRAENSLWI